jgi:hypothetical protein
MYLSFNTVIDRPSITYTPNQLIGDNRAQVEYVVLPLFIYLRILVLHEREEVGPLQVAAYHVHVLQPSPS